MRLYDLRMKLRLTTSRDLLLSWVFMKARNVTFSVQLSLNQSTMKPHVIKIIGLAWAAALNTGCQGNHSTEQSDFPKV